MEYPQTPELDRMLAVHDQSQKIGEFLEWLTMEKGAVMCEWREGGSNGQPKQVTIPWPENMRYYRKEDWEVLNERYGVYGWDHYTKNGDHVLVYNNPDYEYWDEGFRPIHRTIQGWLALYFGLDERKMDAERDAVLAYVRAMNTGEQG